LPRTRPAVKPTRGPAGEVELRSAKKYVMEREKCLRLRWYTR
jgi:hypothetical protein